ncbi:MAG: hypothetical protein ACFB4J_09900 [Elainellaceae cyanobacterium]
MTHFTRSLLITGLLGGSVPILLIGGGILSALALSQVPIAAGVGQLAIDSILGVLQIFGSGSPIQGIFIISLAVGGVSVLFNTYNLLYLSRPIR